MGVFYHIFGIVAALAMHALSLCLHNTTIRCISRAHTYLYPAATVVYKFLVSNVALTRVVHCTHSIV